MPNDTPTGRTVSEALEWVAALHSSDCRIERDADGWFVPNGSGCDCDAPYAIDALIAAVRTEEREERNEIAFGAGVRAGRAATLAEVREKVEGAPSLRATVSAYSSWHEGDPAPVGHPALEGVVFVRKSDVLAALDAMEGK